MLSSPPRRGGGPLRESGAVHMSWATPAFSAVIQAIDYRFAFPSLPDHDGITMERVKGATLMDIMNRGAVLSVTMAASHGRMSRRSS